MKRIELNSERLVLEPLSIKHLSESYVSWINDVEVNKFLETRGGYSIIQLEEYIINQQKKNILFWAIIEKKSGIHIGNIKIDPIELTTLSGEYGILMGEKRFWGKGFAREASELIISYCFKVLGLKQITLGVIEQNTNALKLYLSLGFSITSRKERFGTYDGKLCNLIRMKLSYNEK
mgnify:CR=1 FL=1